MSAILIMSGSLENLSTHTIQTKARIRKAPQLRGFLLALLANLSAGNNEDVRVLLWRAGLLSLAGGLTPHTLCAPEAATLTSFTTSVWVVNRVHGSTADCRADAHPARTSCLSDLNETALLISNCTDGCIAEVGDLADFCGRKFQLCVSGVVRNNFCIVAGGACKACACTELELDVVYEGARRDAAERHAVARLNRNILTNHKGVAELHVLRSKHVPALAVCVESASNKACTVRIVLDGLDLRRDVLLIVLEIDIAQATLVSSSLVARGDAACIVAACLSFLRGKERLHRLIARQQLLVRKRGHVATARGCWLVRFHIYALGKQYGVALLQVHIRLVASCTGADAAAGTE